MHVHTPFDRAKRFGEDIHAIQQGSEKGGGSKLREMAFQFFDACRDAELDLIAITDHNSVEGWSR
ncbi:MAG: hypothetical protein V3T83_07600, partial [Acidobacteriota bacterium]